MDHLLYCFENQLFTDVKFVDKDGNTFSAHSVVISAHEYFYTLLTTKIPRSNEIIVDDIEVAKLIISHIYGLPMNIYSMDISSIIDVLRVASMWMIKLHNISHGLSIHIAEAQITNDEMENIALYGQNVIRKKDIGFAIGYYYYKKPLSEINRSLVLEYANHISTVPRIVLSIRLKLPQMLNMDINDILYYIKDEPYILKLDGVNLSPYITQVLKGEIPYDSCKKLTLEEFGLNNYPK